MYTVVVQAIAGSLFWIGEFIPGGLSWPDNLDLLVIVVIALLTGVTFAVATNSDFPHRYLRRWRLTRESTYPSEWYAAFNLNPDCYVVLHMKDQRRLYGWPDEWPRSSDQGHFRISEPEWLEEDKSTPLEGVSVVLIAATEVGMVEFLQADYIEDEAD